MAVAAAAACGGPVAGDASRDAEADLRPARFASAVDYLAARGGSGLDDWVALQGALAAGFAASCGDTFCEGDYADLTALELRCSVALRDGTLRACTWALAGSQGSVNAATGQLTATGKLYTCPIPARGSVDGFVALLRAPGDPPALRRPLPGGAGTLADALSACGLGH